jgi:hypothetical protein
LLLLQYPQHDCRSACPCCSWQEVFSTNDVQNFSNDILYHFIRKIIYLSKTKIGSQTNINHTPSLSGAMWLIGIWPSSPAESAGDWAAHCSRCSALYRIATGQSDWLIGVSRKTLIGLIDVDWVGWWCWWNYLYFVVSLVLVMLCHTLGNIYIYTPLN